MKRLTKYLGLAIAACLSCLSITALAEPVSAGYQASRVILATADPYRVALHRLELTIAHWQSQADDTAESTRSDMRVASNGFIFNGLQSQHFVADRPKT